jgi:hypothetical protein
MRDASQGRRMTIRQMAASATTMYLCAPEFVTSGPLAAGLRTTPEAAQCVAQSLAEWSNLIPEAAATVFRRTRTTHSAALNELIARCTATTSPRAAEPT